MREVRRGYWLAVLLVVFGCLVPAPAIAQEWYELYANGERALRNNQPQRAVDLLQRAIQRRPQPGLNVPTYGTNFEPRYFPYLRLAEAYLRTEAFEALKTLETSARFAVEPGAERIALEGRARAAIDARRPPPGRRRRLRPPLSRTRLRHCHRRRRRRRQRLRHRRARRRSLRLGPPATHPRLPWLRHVRPSLC